MDTGDRDGPVVGESDQPDLGVVREPADGGAFGPVRGGWGVDICADPNEAAWGRPFPVLSAFGIVLCLLAAYASKENGLLLVPFILAVEFALFGFRTRTGEVSQKVLGAAVALVLVAMTVVVVTERVDLSRLLSTYEIREFSLEERLLTQPRVLLFYIGLILFPAVGRFGIWHDDFPTSTSLFSPPDTLLAIFVIVLLFAIAVGVRKRYPLASLGILWFFVGHAMESTFLPLEMIHEHRNYTASFGVLLVLVTFLAHLSRVRMQLKVVTLILLGVASSFNLTLRAEDWSSFLRHAVSEYLNHPNSARATFHMANVNVLLAARGHREAKEPAYELYRRASELEPNSILPDVGMVIATTQLDGGYDTRWIANAAAKIRSTGGLPSDVAAFKGLRRCVEDGKCKFKVADLMPLFDAAADSRNYKLLIEAAIFQSTATGNGGRALALLKQAMEMAPRQLVPRLNYIEALTQAGRKEEARELLFSMEADGVRALSTERGLDREAEIGAGRVRIGRSGRPRREFHPSPYFLILYRIERKLIPSISAARVLLPPARAMASASAFFSTSARWSSRGDVSGLVAGRWRLRDLPVRSAAEFPRAGSRRRRKACTRARSRSRVLECCPGRDGFRVRSCLGAEIVIAVPFSSFNRPRK
jgi:protein O-mannosyl-transferase